MWDKQKIDELQAVACQLFSEQSEGDTSQTYH